MGLLSTACQKIGLYLANFGNDDALYHVHGQLSYGTESWEQLDIYTPNSDGPHPVVVFFYGGSWSSGDKESYAFVANALAQHGFATVIPDYVKYPQATYPAFQEDAARVTKWLVEHVKEYDLDVDRMHLFGHSAGAHIGMMLLANKHFLAQHDLKPSIYKSFVGLAGPYHFTPEAEQYKQIFGPPENYPAMQAGHFIDGSEPPMLLLHGADDDLVGVSNLENVRDAVIAKGGQVSAKVLPDIGHLGIMAKFSATLNIDNTVVQDTFRFFEEHQ
ncbi:MAG: alpha/beta hydrolase [Rickettsiales bacterium]|nr:alpha/beta hydrolase [Rickettsiales bacterium]